MTIPPWVGVVLLVACMGAQFAFAHWHVSAGHVVSTALGIAVAIVFGRAHLDAVAKLASAHAEIKVLRDSQRPPPLESPPPPQT